MAFSNPSGQQEDSIAEINITPFVDVVLVLLIIFMITAGVVEFGLTIDVPKTREVASGTQDFDYINVTAKGEVYLNNDQVKLYDIVPRIRAKNKDDERPGVYVRADRAVPWEIIAQILAECGAGGLNVSMITKPLENNRRSR